MLESPALASLQFIQEYNRKRVMEVKAEITTKWGRAKNNVVSLDLGNYLHSNRQISYSLTGYKGR